MRIVSGRSRHDRGADLERSRGSLPRPQRSAGARRRRRFAACSAGRDARIGRRVRLRQVHDRQGGGRFAAGDAGLGRRRRDRDRRRRSADPPSRPGPDADGVPGSGDVAQPAHDGRRGRRRTAVGARFGQGGAPCASRWERCWPRSACHRNTPCATRTNSAAASASASSSRAPWLCARRCWSATSRSARSTSACGRRSSICWWRYSAVTPWPICSSRTIWQWCGMCVTGSRSCIWAA